MSTGIYWVGYVVLIVGLIMAAYFLHVPQRWIATGVVVMVGLGILSTAANIRRRGRGD